MADGTKYWFQNNLLHRDKGPAILWADGTKYWFRNGEQIDPPTKESTKK